VLAIAIVTGCTGDDGGSRPPPDKPSADQPARDRIVLEKETMLAAYAATVRRHPTLKDRLHDFVTHHEAHVEALRDALAGTPTPSPRSASSAPARGARIPAKRRDALQALADAEQAAMERRQSVVESASAGGFAVLVASIGACEGAHAALLRAEAAT
jgi:hypothetical protein